MFSGMATRGETAINTTRTGKRGVCGAEHSLSQLQTGITDNGSCSIQRTDMLGEVETGSECGRAVGGRSCMLARAEHTSHISRDRDMHSRPLIIQSTQ
jgi:hypothetical protein